MKGITEFFKKCPALSGYSIRSDYLGPESGNVAIAPDGMERIVKKYASGDMLGQVSFKIMVRENYTGRATALLEAIADWLCVEKSLPELENKRPQYIEVTDSPELIKSDVNSGVYEMKLRLVYYRKGDMV